MWKRTLTKFMTFCTALVLLQGAASAADSGSFEYDGATYTTLKEAVHAVGANAGTIYVLGNADLSENETVVEIVSGADITLTSQGATAFTLTRTAPRWAFSIQAGGTLRLGNIVLDGNARWKEAPYGQWYDRVATDDFCSDWPLIHGVNATGAKLVLNQGAVIQNFYQNHGGNINPAMGGGSPTSAYTELALLYLNDMEVEINGGVIRDNATKSDERNIRESIGRDQIVPGPILLDGCSLTMDGGKLTRNWIVSDTGDAQAGELHTSGYSSDLREGAAGGNLTLVSSTLTMRGGEISQGYASEGGGITALDTAVTIRGGSIIDNVSCIQGGGIALRGERSSLDMTGGAVSRNAATGHFGEWDSENQFIGYSSGGGVYVAGEASKLIPVSISDVVISENSAVKGGGLCLNYADLTVRGDTKIRENQAQGFGTTQAGGGLFLAGGKGIVDGKTQITGNSAGEIGGGLFTDDKQQLTIGENAAIAGNMATDGGGIVVYYKTTVNLTGSASVTGNTAASEGGGILVHRSGTLNLSGNASVTGNTADKGGGMALYDVNAKAAVLEHAVISGNTAAVDNGGAAVFFYAGANSNTTSGGSAFFPNTFYLDGENTEIEGDISLLYADGSGAPTTPSITLISPVSGGKVYQIRFFHPEDAKEKTVVVSPGNYYYDGKSYSLSDAEPCETGFANDLYEIVPGSGYGGEGLDRKLVLGVKAFTVTFDANGGAWTDASLTKDVQTVGGLVTAPDDPHRAGYTFEGWYTGGKDLATGEVTLGDPWDATAEVKAHRTVYAKWAPVPDVYATVTFKIANGTWNGTDSADKTVAVRLTGGRGTLYDADVPTGMKANSGFSGGAWDAPPNTAPDGVTGDLTYTYSFTRQSGGGGGATYYTLTYDTNGGSKLESERHTYGKTVRLTKAPTREGYTFTGWYADQGLTDKIAEVKMNGSKTVHAGWEACKIPGDLNGEDHFAYIIGRDDGLVHPEADITRAEVATIFYRLLNENVRSANETDCNSFTDVRADQWHNTAISTIANLGIVKGRGDGIFAPDAPITRGEFAAIAARFDSEDYDGADKFPDISGHWAAVYINRAAHKGWVRGDNDGNFRPNDPITRAEAVTMINRVLQRLPQSTSDLLPGMNAFPDNVNTSAWYYFAIQEAANGHDYERKADGIHEKWTVLTK